MKKTIAEREKLFEISLQAYVPIYGAKMIQNFFDYWTEMNANGRLMRFEKEKTWSLPRRLARWKMNSYDNKKENNETERKQRIYEGYRKAADFFRSKSEQFDK